MEAPRASDAKKNDELVSRLLRRTVRGLEVVALAAASLWLVLLTTTTTTTTLPTVCFETLSVALVAALVCCLATLAADDDCRATVSRPSRAVLAGLGCPLLFPVAALSYTTYLTQGTAIALLARCDWPPLASKLGAAFLALFLLANASGLALSLLVERPAMHAARSLEQRLSSNACLSSCFFHDDDAPPSSSSSSSSSHAAAAAAKSPQQRRLKHSKVVHFALPVVQQSAHDDHGEQQRGHPPRAATFV